MQRIKVDTAEGGYDVVYGEIRELPNLMAEVGLRTGRCLIVTDENVGSLYLSSLSTLLVENKWDPVTNTLPAGEQSKSSDELSRLYDFAIQMGIDRETPVLALGGGVIGDLAGYFASTILRGVPLIHIPTTLVAQVDSAIGGKTGINHRKGKNLIGSFYQPRVVLADTRWLATLTEREWKAGLGEVVKHALIDSVDLTKQTTAKWDVIAGRDESTLATMIPRFAQVKVDIVSQDVHERNIRAYLNLGHTIAHAIEKVLGYGTILHGEAVATGLAVSVSVSANRYPSVDFSTAWTLLERLGWKLLPDVTFGQIAAAMTVDKKNLGGVRRFVLLEGPGNPRIAEDVTLAEIERGWSHTQM